MEQVTINGTVPPSDTKQARWKRRFKTFRRWWAILGTSLTALFLLFQFFACRASGPAPAAMVSDTAVRVTVQPDRWRFEPMTLPAKTIGFLFFPGSQVDPVAYAPLARTMAKKGYTVVLIPLPYRSAPLKSQKEAVLRTAAETIESSKSMRWVIGGHSLGGVFATRFAREYPHLTAGLILIGTSHPRDFDLSHATYDVTKIYGTRDGLASPEEVWRYAPNLPQETHWIEIQGGNHAQFGWYGRQLGDHTATISHQEQQDQLAMAVRDALDRVALSNSEKKK